ncbi:hypothetical protein CFC21_037832, partial [Triticum aestivum]
IHRDIKASN